MSDRRFLTSTIVGVGIGTVCLVLAGVFDSAVLAVGGALFILGAFVAKERWLDGGRMFAVVALIVLVAFVVQTIAS